MKPVCRYALCLLLIATSSAAAAGDDVSVRLRRSLGAFGPELVSTGFLYDRVIPMSRIDDVDGSATARAISRSQWLQIYEEISRAALDPRPWPEPGELRSANQRAPREVIPIAILNVRYQRIRRGALDDGSLRVEGDRLVPGVGSPLEERRAFAACVLDDETYRGGAVDFFLDPERIFTNEAAVPAAVDIDFDDGRGFVAVTVGGRHRVAYASAGSKTIRVRASWGGSTLASASRFTVQTLQAPDPYDTLLVTGTIPYDGGFASGEAYVYWSDSNGALVKPAILIEGFDLDNSMDWDELYALVNKEGLVESLRTDGFDPVVLNFADATDYLQRNAFLVVELIERVKSLIDPMQDIVLVGASMGGLVSRYALAYMEQNAIDHRVRTFISFDSPHKGAVIPLGLQYWLFFFQDQSSDAAFLLSRLDTPAARQMLVHHYTDPPTASGTADALRASFLADLAAVGSYPTNLRKVALANGSGTQLSQGFAAAEQIIEYEYTSLLVDITGNVWAVPDASSELIFEGLIDFILLPPDALNVTVSGTLPYDNAPGGSRDSMKQMDDTPAPYGDIIALHERHCFIPTISALDLDVTDLFYDIAGDPDILSHTPFDDVFVPQTNEPHSCVTPGSAPWLRTEIVGLATAVQPGVGRASYPALAQNYPNPFNPVTNITFHLPAATHVTIAVYDAGGHHVRTLHDGAAPAGDRRVIWDGRDDSANAVGSGVYFCRMVAGGREEARKMVLIR